MDVTVYTGSIMDLREVLGLAGVPAVMAVVEVGKRMFPEASEKWYPVWALGVAMAFNLVIGWRLGFDLVDAGATGLIAGLAASGLYSQAKAAGRHEPARP